MWYWTGGLWWPGFVLMAVGMVICMVMMVRMMGGMPTLPRHSKDSRDATRDARDPDERSSWGPGSRTKRVRAAAPAAEAGVAVFVSAVARDAGRSSSDEGSILRSVYES